MDGSDRSILLKGMASRSPRSILMTGIFTRTVMWPTMSPGLGLWDGSVVARCAVTSSVVGAVMSSVAVAASAVVGDSSGAGVVSLIGVKEGLTPLGLGGAVGAYGCSMTARRVRFVALLGASSGSAMLRLRFCLGSGVALL